MEPGKVCQFSTATGDNIIITTVTVTNVQVDCMMMTALIVAAYRGHVDIMRLLLQSGKVHVDRQDREVSMFFIIHLHILFIHRIILNECVYCVVYIYVCSSSI